MQVLAVKTALLNAFQFRKIYITEVHLELKKQSPEYSITLELYLGYYKE